MTKNHSKHDMPIFRRILIPLMTMLFIEAAILYAAFGISDLNRRVTQYAVDVVEGRLSARKNYIESMMQKNWMNISLEVEEINRLMRAKLLRREITLEELNRPGGRVNEFLTEAAEKLVGIMRANRVTGAFIILNTDDLDEMERKGTLLDKQGVYIRDQDPLSSPTDRNNDFLLERAPAAVIRSTGISTDIGWSPCFQVDTAKQPLYPFFYMPYQTAFRNKGKYDWQDLGFWGTATSLAGEDRPFITYSVPLILRDGTVYGVLGVDLTLDYIRTLLPEKELTGDEGACYIIGLEPDHEEKEEAFAAFFGSGDFSWAASDRGMEDAIRGDLINQREPMPEKAFLHPDSGEYFCRALPLEIYSSNVPYPNVNWVLGAVVRNDSISKYPNLVRMVFVIAAGSTILFGIAASVFISYHIQKPIAQLNGRIRTADPTVQICLPKTGIREIDVLSGEVERLSEDVIESGRRFSKIIQMSSEKLGGFQIDDEQKTLFITEGFFDVFGLKTPENLQSMSIMEFRSILSELSEHIVEQDSGINGEIYEITRGGKKCFIRMRVAKENHMHYGFAKDVTQSLLRNRMIIFERDHDALTSLLNRRAFRRQITELLEAGDRKFGVGALLMMDLDNLKSVNDTYGHQYGDAYIRTAAKTIMACSSAKALSARISGDEFNVFYYGERREEIEAQISRLKEAFSRAEIEVEDGQRRQVRISAGIAWYPVDAVNYEMLMRYADSALYIAKRNRKGEFVTFDIKNYQEEDDVRRKKDGLIKLLEDREFHFVFQPIFRVSTGTIYAYEALMRPDQPAFSSPAEVIETARMESKMNQIENVMVPESIEAFFRLADQGGCSPDVRLFFNSIADQTITREMVHYLSTNYHDKLHRLVMEITEEKAVSQEKWEYKSMALREMGVEVALDDYGSGYNSEKALLMISPKYIKVDIAIIKDNQNDPDKKAIMEYIVNYAHERGKMIIAEGVETREEAETCIRLGADLIQGFYLGCPSETLGDTDPVAREEIRKITAQYRI
ncbi:EAL domain-containing protein [[Clostridium] aminophilum]|uniref:EAL domain-containing protein n=1 Tax=[Clostridium] aminophilum TaxID=1526 RepID=UPI00331A7497